MEINEKESNSRTKKMMLWFGMISMAMTFAGLTSAYVVSSSREDWLEGFQLPTVFSLSTAIILLSSLTFYFAKRTLKQDKLNQFKKHVVGHPFINTSFCLLSISRLWRNYRFGILFHGCRELNYNIIFICTGTVAFSTRRRWTSSLNCSVNQRLSQSVQ